MAKILLGNGVTAIRGTINGVIYSWNKGGAYSKSWAAPTGTPSIYQVNQRALFGTIAPQWTTALTTEERRAWNLHCGNFPVKNVFGETRYLSGYQLFCWLNMNISLVGGTLITLPPVKGAISNVNPLSITAVSATNTLGVWWGNSPIPANHTLMVWTTSQLPIGQSYFRNKIKLFYKIPATAASPWSFTTQYSDRFGLLVAGYKLYCRAFYMDNLSGLTGPVSQAETIII